MARFGKIGDQYGDDARNPLIAGKLYYYESGTNTPKDTYKDVNLSILNTNPVLLSAAGRPPNIFFNGTAKVILTDSDDVQIEERDPEGGDIAEGAFSSWNSLSIYNIPDIIVGSDNNYYVSITDGNQGNDPTTDLVNWTQVKFTRVWNANETYGLYALVQGSGGNIYKSTIANNLNNDPTTDLTNWTGATTATLSPVVRSSTKTFAYRNF